MKLFIFFFGLALIISSCGNKKSNEINPPADGFDLANSDQAAIQLADSIMMAMGGRENWDKTRFISWNFYGRRKWVWDKKTNRVRVESIKDSTIYLANLDSMAGRV